MEITIGAMRAIGRRRGGQARAAIEIMADHIELMNTRLAEVEAERDTLRRLCLDAANHLDDLGTASGDTMAARLRAAGGD